MNKTGHSVLIGPGEVAFEKTPYTIGTLLGSCVAITLWHPKLHIGGMCHIVLPEKQSNISDNKYASCAVKTLMKYVTKNNTSPADYQVEIYGGGNMFPNMKVMDKFAVGQRNYHVVKQLLKENGFNVYKENVGGNCYRRITLHLDTGAVSLTSKDV